jgi:hypothetical protein
MPPRKKIVVDPSVATTAEQPVEEQKKENPKREKKNSTKHKVVAIITPDGIQGSFQPEIKRPLIAHLPVHSSEIQFHDQPFIYDPKPPEQFEAFNVADIDPFSEEATFETTTKDQEEGGTTHQEQTDYQEQPNNETIDTKKQKSVSSTNTNTTATTRKEYGPTKLLVQFANTKHTHEIPNSTDLACFWCCDSFQGRPCVIPMKIVDTVWHVYGNFCTPQCAMAHLLSELLDTHVRWERIALLNKLYSTTVGKIYPAPSRESLQRFGGPISIDDFRNICESQRIRVDVHLPPMVSILASMDTKPIDFYESSMKNNTLNPYQSIVKMNDEPSNYKLKRSKPLKDKESTLDACLQITTRVN